jgi:hypothetical protein
VCSVLINLRPLEENNGQILERWNSDAKVLYYFEGDKSIYCPREEVRDIFVQSSKTLIALRLTLVEVLRLQWEGSVLY